MVKAFEAKSFQRKAAREHGIYGFKSQSAIGNNEPNSYVNMGKELIPCVSVFTLFY